MALCAVLGIPQVTLESQRLFCYKSLNLCLMMKALCPELGLVGSDVAQSK